MRWSWCFAVLLVCGCEQGRGGNDSSRGVASTEAQRAGAARPAPVQATPVPKPPQHTTPFSPRTQEAKFFSRPADSWQVNELTLTSYTLEVQVADGTAKTTLDVQITNPTAAQTEALIELPMPPDAAVTDATLWVGDKPMVGVMLGSGKAQQVYEEVVGRRRDPLLVSWRAPDMLALSIFPLEAKQTRRFKLSWVEPAIAEQLWVPAFYNGDNEIGFPSAITVNGQSATRDGHWVKTPSTQPASAGDWRMIVQPGMTPTMVAVIIDTSGQLGAARGPQWTEIESFLSALAGRAKVSLLAADWFLQELGTGRTLEELDAAREKFLPIRSAGLFDQQQALARAGELAGTSGAIVVFSGRYPDYTPLPDSVRSPIYWVNPSLPDDAFGPVSRSGGRVVADGASIGKSVHALTPPSDAGFDWLPLETATGHVVWMGSRKGASPPPNEKPTPMEAIFYKAMLRRSEIPPNKIVSPGTSILVLESEAQYKQHGIKNEKGEIVRQGGDSKTIAGLLDEQDQGEGWSGFGGLGLRGTGPGGGGSGWATIGTGRFGTIGHGSATGSGYGIGYGRLSSRHYSPPQIRIGNATVGGNLDKNIIRRYIRRHLPRLRYCYEKELLKHDTLQGTATADFTISAEGKVVSAHVEMSDPKGKQTAECMKKALVNIAFPKPQGGGFVKVRYPFVLTPGPGTLWTKARVLLDEAKPGHLQAIGKLFGIPQSKDRIELAWQLAEGHLRSYATPPIGYVVVARLLRGTGSTQNDNDARRVLSEAGPRHPEVIAEQLTEWGYPQDADRVLKQPTAYGGGIGTLGWGTPRR